MLCRSFPRTLSGRRLTNPPTSPPAAVNSAHRSSRSHALPSFDTSLPGHICGGLSPLPIPCVQMSLRTETSFSPQSTDLQRHPSYCDRWPTRQQSAATQLRFQLKNGHLYWLPTVYIRKGNTPSSLSKSAPLPVSLRYPQTRILAVIMTPPFLSPALISQSLKPNNCIF